MKVSHRFISVAALSMLICVPNVAFAKKPPEMTPLQLQALQSKEFETTKDKLFDAVMTVVQDIGYQVQSADLQTGFITAMSATEQKTNIFEAFGGGSSTANTRMTAFVQNLPNGMARVRLNFLVSKTSQSMYGQSNQKDKPVLDAAIYNNAWDKIDEALFVMGALEPSKNKDVPKNPSTDASASVPSQGS